MGRTKPRNKHPLFLSDLAQAANGAPRDAELVPLPPSPTETTSTASTYPAYIDQSAFSMRPSRFDPVPATRISPPPPELPPANVASSVFDPIVRDPAQRVKIHRSRLFKTKKQRERDDESAWVDEEVFEEVKRVEKWVREVGVSPVEDQR
jgi:hypothetical protein